MSQASITPANRLPFFDNLRFLMVLLVLIFHAAASYGSVAFWPFHEANPSRLIDLFMFLCDVFTMATLFFIAGYFALPSWQKSGGWSFIKDKIKRLGIPWLVVTVFVLPALDYIHYSAQSLKNGLPVRSYGMHWLLSMKKIAEFHVGWMDMSIYLNMTEQSYQRHMWFVSLLFLFFAVFAVLLKANKKWGSEAGRSARDEPPSQKSIFGVLTLVGLLTILLFALVRFFIYPDFMGLGWFSLGNLIQFQCGKLVIYASYFGLGSYAYSRRWFTEGADFGRTWIWGLTCFLLFGANMLVLKNISTANSPSLGLRLAFAVLYPLWTLSFLGVFTAFAVRYWNRSTPLNRDFAANSYSMYLVHYIFPMTIPLLLSAWGGAHVLIKFGAVALTTVLLSYGISQYVIKPFPRFVVTGLIGLSIILAVVT